MQICDSSDLSPASTLLASNCNSASPISDGLCMNWVFLCYDFTTASIETFTKGLDPINHYFLGLSKDAAEIEGLPLSEA